MTTQIGFVALMMGALSVTPAVAQEFTLTTSSANLVASKATIDVPELTGNPDAIIIATPLGDTARLNPHPLGVWYYGGKWSVFNTDHASMPVGLTYKVQYFLKRGDNQFLYVVTGDATRSSVLDNPALNGNPNAQFKIFQNHSPEVRAAGLNGNEARAEYDAAAGKWIIRNVNGQRLTVYTAYNVVITSTGPAATAAPPRIGSTSEPLAAAPSQPTSLAPLTVVLRTEWALPNQGNILMSSGLCKLVAGTYNDPSLRATDTVIVTGQAAADGAYLKWTATIDDGAIHVNVCNWKRMTLYASDALNLNGRKVNILVLR